jgi:hypothetical protein
MSENAKPQTDTMTARIGATANFEDGACSYLDSIEGMAIPGLVFSDLQEGDLAALRAASDALRPAFEELAGTFSGPYRERGYQLLWALMKATIDIGYIYHSSSGRRKKSDLKAIKMEATRSGKAPKQEEFANAVKSEADLLKITPAKSKKFAQSVAPGLKERLGLNEPPGRDRILAAVDLLRDRQQER